jgi:hypothetical protein
MKIVATAVTFPSFEEFSMVAKPWDIGISIPEKPEKGIHFVGMFDDQLLGGIQHACLVVVGDYEVKWELRRIESGRSLRGSNTLIHTIAFDTEAIPFFVNGEECKGDVSMHSLYSPSCRCVRAE